MTALIQQLDKIADFEINQILDLIEEIENAFSKIDLERFDKK